jgi:predicted kinase
VVAVGSFRSEQQRQRFREIAANCGATATIIRIACGIETAAERICSRHGERGPDETALRQIDAEINQATDIDVVLANDTSVADFCRQSDLLMQATMDCLVAHDLRSSLLRFGALEK